MFDISTITTEQREHWRALVAAHTGPKTRGYTPYASPFAGLNASATRIESVPVVMRDFVVQQGRAPIWAAQSAPAQLLLHARMAEPIIERSALNLTARLNATAKQCGVDCLLGLFALIRAVATRALGHKEDAWEMVGAHAINIASLLHVTVTLVVTIGLIVCLGL